MEKSMQRIESPADNLWVGIKNLDQHNLFQKDDAGDIVIDFAKAKMLLNTKGIMKKNDNAYLIGNTLYTEKLVEGRSVLESIENKSQSKRFELDWIKGIAQYKQEGAKKVQADYLLISEIGKAILEKLEIEEGGVEKKYEFYPSKKSGDNYWEEVKRLGQGDRLKILVQNNSVCLRLIQESESTNWFLEVKEILKEMREGLIFLNKNGLIKSQEELASNIEQWVSRRVFGYWSKADGELCPITEKEIKKMVEQGEQQEWLKDFGLDKSNAQDWLSQLKELRAVAIEWGVMGDGVLSVSKDAEIKKKKL